jgi:hypothetical protein
VSVSVLARDKLSGIHGIPSTATSDVPALGPSPFVSTSNRRSCSEQQTQTFPSSREGKYPSASTCGSGSATSPPPSHTTHPPRARARSQSPGPTEARASRALRDHSESVCTTHRKR